jgi:hypothetical protein
VTERVPTLSVRGDAEILLDISSMPGGSAVRVADDTPRTIRRWVERGPSVRKTLPLRPFCRGCIIATRGYDSREGQPSSKSN